MTDETRSTHKQKKLRENVKMENQKAAVTLTTDALKLTLSVDC